MEEYHAQILDLETGMHLQAEGCLIAKGGFKQITVHSLYPNSLEVSGVEEVLLQDLEWFSQSISPRASVRKLIPFVTRGSYYHPNSEDYCYTIVFGYAASKQVIKTFKWLITSDLPKDVYDHLMGTLCGYSVEAVEAFGV